MRLCRPKQPALPIVRHAPAPLQVGTQSLRPLQIAELRAGDIGFEYKRRRLAPHQWAIFLGEAAQNWGRPAYRGEARVLHAFLVTGVDLGANRVRIIEAAHSPDRIGIKCFGMGFDGTDPATDEQAEHLFYRFRDPRMGTSMAEVAANWAALGANNFSTKNAMTAIFHTKSIHLSARRRLLHLLNHLDKPQPVPGLFWGHYSVMCSELLGSVGAVSAMRLYMADTGQTRATDAALLGLSVGSAGNVFNCDPKALVPMVLHARMSRDPQVEAVGYMPAVDGG